jgi:anti-sigma factor RsiW
MSSHDLTCAALVELVTDYLEGALSPDERERVDAHLGACGGCTAYIGQFRETIRLVGVLREDDVSPEARATLLSAFAGWKRDPP